MQGNRRGEKLGIEEGRKRNMMNERTGKKNDEERKEEGEEKKDEI